MVKNFLITSSLVFFLIQICFAENQLYKYHNHQQNEKLIVQISKSYNNILTSEILTKTSTGKPIHAIKITGKNKTVKPTILVVGGLEGNELTSVEISMDLIKYFGSNYKTNDVIRSILDDCNLYIIPNANPEATENFFQKLHKSQKVNLTKVDNDLDGLTNEDDVNDLNKDGIISIMRVKDLQGEWIINKEYPIMQKYTLEDSVMERYSIISEGVDDDDDGLINEDGIGGVDIDKNFTYNFEFSDKEAGTYALSQPESKAIADFIFNHPEIVMVYSFSDDNNLLSTWASTNKPAVDYLGEIKKAGNISKVLQEDAKVLEIVSEKYKNIYTQIEYFSTDKNNGNFAEWAYYHTGRISITAPAWRFSLDPVDSTKCKNKDIEFYKWLLRTDQQEKIVDWQKINHPDFPNQEVEIGGYKPFCRENAPKDSLKQLFIQNRSFVLTLGKIMPKINIADIQSTKLSDGVHRVEFFIANTGNLATSTELGKHLRWIPKIRVNMDESVELLSGKKFFVLDKIEGNGGVKKLSWLIKTNKKSIEIKVHSPIFGDITKEVTL